jgi:hypothetical protein
MVIDTESVCLANCLKIRVPPHSTIRGQWKRRGGEEEVHQAAGTSPNLVCRNTGSDAISFTLILHSVWLLEKTKCQTRWLFKNFLAPKRSQANKANLFSPLSLSTFDHTDS